jgi:hypothetical protein
VLGYVSRTGDCIEKLSNGGPKMINADLGSPTVEDLSELVQLGSWRVGRS